MTTETTPFDQRTREIAAAKVPTKPAPTAADLAGASITRNTRRAYEGALRQFKQAGHPDSDEGVAVYLGGLYEQGLSASCAEVTVAALRFRAKLHGRPSPVGVESLRVLSGFRRMAADRGTGRVAGVRWEEADRAAEMAERSGDLCGLRDAAILAVASDALLRVSEVAALDVEDVNLVELTLLVRRSKTDQEGKGAVQFLGPPTVARIRVWLLSAGLTEGALFRAVDKTGRMHGERLTTRTIRRIVVRRARAAGVDGRVSGHSLRVGSAQSLAMAGASLVEMQVVGRWRSPIMPGHYARGQLARQGAVARLRYGMSWTLHDPPAP